MIHLFTGTYEGSNFIGASSLIPHEVMRAERLVDTYSRRNGPKLPQLNAAGFVIRATAPDVLPQMLYDRFNDCPDVVLHAVGSVAAEDLAPFFSPEELTESFRAPRTFEPEVAADAA